MPSLLHHFGRWPLWYWLLAAYTASLSIRDARRVARLERAATSAELPTSDPLERRRRQGRRAGRLFAVGSWLVAGLLLLSGWDWARVVVAVGYARSAFKGVHDFATGFAEGRKSASLAAAPEYVRGRVAPRATDHLVAALYVGVTRGIPLAAVLYAIVRLPGHDLTWRSVGLSIVYLVGGIVVLTTAFFVWAIRSTPSKTESIGSHADVRALIQRLVDRGANLATVVFRVRGRKQLALKFTKHLSGGRSGRVFTTYSPASELRLISTLVVPRRSSAKFRALIDEVRVGSGRATGRTDWRGRHVLQLNHGRNVDGATALAVAVFARVFDADIARDATATSDLLLDRDAPHLTGVAPPDASTGASVSSPS